MTDPEPCGQCDGKGRLPGILHECPACLGVGRVPTETVIDKVARAIYETHAEPDDSWDDEKLYGYPSDTIAQARAAVQAYLKETM